MRLELKLVFGVALVLMVLSLTGVQLPPPEGWLEAWTKWIASVVGIVVAARVLWAGANKLSS